MKKLYLILLLFSFTGCFAQKVEPEPPKIVTANFEVMQVTKETATLFSRAASPIYEVDNVGLEKEKEYFFILQLAPGKLQNIHQATVLYFGISPEQARRENQAAVKLHNKINGPPKE